MTLIVGVIEGGDVWMGSDSAACADNQRDLLAQPKHFRAGKTGEFLIGCCGTMRLTQVLQFHFDVPTRQTSDVYEFMVRDFVSAVRECLKEHECLDTKESLATLDGGILVAHNGRLFEIQPSWQVSEVALPFQAMGSAYPNAYGALYALQEFVMPPEKRVRLALEAGAHFVMNVSAPFRIEKL